MAINQGKAVYRELLEGRDGMPRASVWQGAAGAIFGNNCAYSGAGSATATVTSQAKIAVATTYTIGGRILSKGITDNFWTLSGVTVPINSFQKYALLIDDLGVASVQEATPNTVSAVSVKWVNVTPAAKAFPQNPWAPIIFMLNQSKAILSILTIATNASTPFIPGTTLLGAAGITATFIDGIDPALMPLIYTPENLLVGLSI